MIVIIFVGILGIAVTMIWNFYVILIGRFLFGLSAGMFTSVSPRYVEETVPIHLYELVGPCVNVG